MKNSNDSCATGRFYGIGLGPGDPNLLTLYAVNILCSVDVIFHATGADNAESVSGNIVKSVSECRARRIALSFPMTTDVPKREAAWKQNALRISDELNCGNDCAFVTIGDPLIYSTYIYLLRAITKRLPNVQVKTVPGITAFQAAAARVNLPLVEAGEILTVIPAHTEENVIHPILDHADTLVFLKSNRQLKRIVKTLREKGFAGKMVYAARVGLDGELIREVSEGLTGYPDEYLSMLIVKRKHA